MPFGPRPCSLEVLIVRRKRPPQSRRIIAAGKNLMIAEQDRLEIAADLGGQPAIRLGGALIIRSTLGAFAAKCRQNVVLAPVLRRSAGRGSLFEDRQLQIEVRVQAVCQAADRSS